MATTLIEQTSDATACTPEFHEERQPAAPSVRRGFCFYLERLLQKLKDSQQTANGPLQNQGPQGSLANFFCQNIPRVSFEFFMERFVRLGNIDEQTMVCAFVYMTRLTRADFVRDPRLLHKLFATSIFVAYKYLNESDIWFLEDFAKLSGITPGELLN